MVLPSLNQMVSVDDHNPVAQASPTFYTDSAAAFSDHIFANVYHHFVLPIGKYNFH